MTPTLRLCAFVAVATCSAVIPAVHAQTPLPSPHAAALPGSGGAPQGGTVSAGRAVPAPEAGAEGATSDGTVGASGTSMAPASGGGGVVWRRVTADNDIPTREEVMHESAAMNHAQAIPRGELSLAPRTGAPEGGFLRKF